MNRGVMLSIIRFRTETHSYLRTKFGSEIADLVELFWRKITLVKHKIIVSRLLVEI